MLRTCLFQPPWHGGDPGWRLSACSSDLSFPSADGTLCILLHQWKSSFMPFTEGELRALPSSICWEWHPTTCLGTALVYWLPHIFPAPCIVLGSTSLSEARTREMQSLSELLIPVGGAIWVCRGLRAHNFLSGLTQTLFTHLLCSALPLYPGNPTFYQSLPCDGSSVESIPGLRIQCPLKFFWSLTPSSTLFGGLYNSPSIIAFMLDWFSIPSVMLPNCGMPNP